LKSKKKAELKFYLFFMNLSISNKNFAKKIK